MTGKTGRPLSPHLQVYRPQLTSVMSILHRICGMALVVGIATVTWGLLAAAMGEDAWKNFHGFFLTLVGKMMLTGWAAVLSYHMCNGTRHLLWDTGRLLELKDAYRAGYAVLGLAFMLTVFLWLHIWQGE